jgi:hypothetical protein
VAISTDTSASAPAPAPAPAPSPVPTLLLIKMDTRFAYPHALSQVQSITSTG